MQTQQEQAPLIRSRPCGVMLIAIFEVFQGIFLVIAGILGILGLVVLIFNSHRGGQILLHGGINFVLGILCLILAFGLFVLARWAYWAVVIVTIIDLINSGSQLWLSNFEAWGHWIPIAISLAILLYFLLDRRVRAAFRM